MLHVTFKCVSYSRVFARDFSFDFSSLHLTRCNSCLLFLFPPVFQRSACLPTLACVLSASSQWPPLRCSAIWIGSALRRWCRAVSAMDRSLVARSPNTCSWSAKTPIRRVRSLSTAARYMLCLFGSIFLLCFRCNALSTKRSLCTRVL